MSMKVYEIVTQRIIKEMENGNIRWKKPWICPFARAVSHSTGKPYSLLNQWLLQYEGEYLTFKQVQDEGGRVIRGSKAEMVLFFKPYKIKSTDQGGSEEENSAEEKMKYVLRCMEGKDSINHTATMIVINHASLIKCIHNYQSLGIDGLSTTSKNSSYSTALKEMAVKDYLTGVGAQSDICKKYGIRSTRNSRTGF